MTYKDWVEGFKAVVRLEADDPLRPKAVARLLRQTRVAARTAVTPWQEAEVLGLRAMFLWEAGRFRAAAKAYEQLAAFYRGYSVSYTRATASALEEAAEAAVRAGQRGTAKRVASEVLSIRARFPDYGQALRAMIQALADEQLERNRKATAKF